MDSELREKERIYGEFPTAENYLSLLRAILRAGKILEVNHPSMARNWGSELIEFLSDKIPQLKIFDYEIIPWNIFDHVYDSHRSFLIGQVRQAITADIDQTLNLSIGEAAEQGLGIIEADLTATMSAYRQVRQAAGGNYNIMGIAFAFNQNPDIPDNFILPGYFYVVTLNDEGFAEHIITMVGSNVEYDLECQTNYIGVWEDVNNEDEGWDLTYDDAGDGSDICLHGQPSQEGHKGTSCLCCGVGSSILTRLAYTPGTGVLMCHPCRTLSVVKTIQDVDEDRADVVHKHFDDAVEERTGLDLDLAGV